MISVSPTAAVHDDVQLGTDVGIGHASLIDSSAGQPTHISDRVTIGAFCLIEAGCYIESDVDIDHYCAIGAGATIGRGAKILRGVQVHRNAKIGARCIVGGDVAERAVLEDDVTFLGEIAHSHRNPNLDWDTTDEPSPVIRNGSFVGVAALLIGGLSIGPQAYVGAGEVVRTDVPANTVVYRGQRSPVSAWHGVIKCRDIHPEDSA